MQTLIPIILIGLFSGVAVGLQSPLASMITQRLGMVESIFIVHLGGTLLNDCVKNHVHGIVPRQFPLFGT